MHQEAKIAALILSCSHYARAVELERVGGMPIVIKRHNKAGDMYAQQVANITKAQKDSFLDNTVRVD